MLQIVSLFLSLAPPPLYAVIVCIQMCRDRGDYLNIFYINRLNGKWEGK